MTQKPRRDAWAKGADMDQRKTGIITFKADESLLKAMRGIGNRSEFIRTAILSALENRCPLCGGTGLLTPNQMRHWDEFAIDHPLTECEHCSEVRLVCSKTE
jgi:hypothetical protein